MNESIQDFIRNWFRN